MFDSKTVVRGVYSPNFAPVAHVQSGDVITAECVTHQAPQDYAKMIRQVQEILNVLYNLVSGKAEESNAYYIQAPKIELPRCSGLKALRILFKCSGSSVSAMLWSAWAAYNLVSLSK
jgi:hypothetical protein